MQVAFVAYCHCFSKEEVSETEIENLKQSSEMDTMMQELSSYLPAVKEVLIDERDFYLASKIWSCPQKIFLRFWEQDICREFLLILKNCGWKRNS